MNGAPGGTILLDGATGTECERRRGSGAAALFVMHTPVQMTPPAIAAMLRATTLPVGAYANNPKDAWLTPAEYAEHARAWIAQGAAFVALWAANQLCGLVLELLYGRDLRKWHTPPLGILKPV